MEAFTVSKQFTFSASHQIDGLRPGHKCARLHGHTYTCTIIVSTDVLDSNGMVMDFAQFDAIIDSVTRRYDHSHLNRSMKSNPTSENLATEIYGIAANPILLAMKGREGNILAVTVRVSEQPTTYAEYTETLDNNG